MMEPEQLGADLVTVLSNDVVFRILDQFLDLQDLKNLRLLSRHTNQIICNRVIASRCQLVLWESSLLPSFLDALTFTPRHLRLFPFPIEAASLVETEEIDRRVQQLVEDCETLSVLELYPKEKNKYCPGDRDLVLEPSRFLDHVQGSALAVPHCPNVLQTITSCRNLSALHLNGVAYHFLNHPPPVICVNTFQNLKELYIRHYWLSYKWIPKILLSCKDLRVLALGGIHGNDNMSLPPGTNHSPEFRHSFQIMLYNNRNTLVSVQGPLTLATTSQLPDVCSAQFPLLNELAIHVHAQDEDGTTMRFVKAVAPQLEKLKLHIIEETNFSWVPRLSWRARELAVLFEASANETNMLQPFTTLRSLRLRKLSLTCRTLSDFAHVHESDDEGLVDPSNDVFSWLPESVEEFHLEEWPYSVFNPESLNHLHNLSKLHLQLLNDIDDEFVHAICLKLTQLEELQLIQLPGITNAALLVNERGLEEAAEDEDRSEAPPPISLLGGLRVLKICDCWNIDSDVARGIQLPNLCDMVLDVNTYVDDLDEIQEAEERGEEFDDLGLDDEDLERYEPNLLDDTNFLLLLMQNPMLEKVRWPLTPLLSTSIVQPGNSPLVSGFHNLRRVNGEDVPSHE